MGRLVHAELNAESETQGGDCPGDRDLGVLNASDSNHVCGFWSPGNERSSEPWTEVENNSYLMSYLRNPFRKEFRERGQKVKMNCIHYVSTISIM